MGRFAAGALRVRGRASRCEYWWWMLVNVLVLAATQILIPSLITGRWSLQTLSVGPFGSLFFANVDVVSATASDASGSPIVAFSLWSAGFWMLLTVIPGFTVAVRRLHDSNLSGWWVLLALFPIGAFVLLLLAARGPRAEGARFDLSLQAGPLVGRGDGAGTRRGP